MKENERDSGAVVSDLHLSFFKPADSDSDINLSSEDNVPMKVIIYFWVGFILHLSLPGQGLLGQQLLQPPEETSQEKYEEFFHET